MYVTINFKIRLDLGVSVMKSLERIDRKIEEELEYFSDMAIHIARNPEISEKEFQTSAMLVQALRERGFSVEYPYAGLATAFNAVRKNKKTPVVAFMAEYDALPEIGHACGHNLNGVMSVLAGTALAEVLADDLTGEIRVVGTPAEETNGAKVAMADTGVFDDVDFAMMVHGGSGGEAHPLYRALALVPVEFDFRGRPAHAAAAPWEGLNALNGLQLFYHALDMLRQHVKPDTRIHGVITKGGDAPNIVPDFAQASFYFRSGGVQLAFRDILGGNADSHATLVRSLPQKRFFKGQAFGSGIAAHNQATSFRNASISSRVWTSVAQKSHAPLYSG